MLELFRYRLIAAAWTVVAVLGCGREASAQYPRDWTDPFPAFRIAGNLYYVGSKGLASFLVTTPAGHILINSNLESSVPQLRESVERLGFRFGDIKILLISHAHWDHNAGSAKLKALTGAQYFVMDADVAVVESGGRTDYQYGATPGSQYPPTSVDRVLHHGDTVSLGDAMLVAHLTPGHTKGCTTWSLQVRDGDAVHQAVIVCSAGVNPGTRLVGNAAYPAIQSDYELTFHRLGALRADIFLGAHGVFFDLADKYARLKRGEGRPFHDPEGYRRYVDERAAAYRAELARQLATPPE
jgi:metallo-beta-lactamase class B